MFSAVPSTRPCKKPEYVKMKCWKYSETCFEALSRWLWGLKEVSGLHCVRLWTAKTGTTNPPPLKKIKSRRETLPKFPCFLSIPAPRVDHTGGPCKTKQHKPPCQQRELSPAAGTPHQFLILNRGNGTNHIVDLQDLKGEFPQEGFGTLWPYKWHPVGPQQIQVFVLTTTMKIFPLLTEAPCRAWGKETKGVLCGK